MSYVPTTSGSIFVSNTTKAIGNEQTPMSIIPTGSNTLTGGNTMQLPANFWKAGRALRLAVHAVYTSDTLTTGATVAVILGGTTLTSVVIGALANNTTNQAVDGEVNVVCSGVASGNATLLISGTMKFLTGVNQQTNVFGNLSTTTTASVPVASAGLLDVTTVFSANRPVQQVTTLAVLLEYFN